MLEFQLFKIKAHLPPQPTLFEPGLLPHEVVAATIKSAPSSELRQNVVWHIGNVSSIDAKSLYFRIGRTTRATVEQYADNNFFEQEEQFAPYTHVIYDIPHEVCAIAKKARLSPSIVSIANNFEKLLNRSVINHKFNAIFEIGEIKDPKQFIEQIKTAYKIYGFWMTFTRPNPFDTDEDFVKPYERMVEAANGRKGKATVEGENLNKDLVERLARSAASSADNAGVRLQASSDSKPVSKSIKGNNITFSEEAIESGDDKLKVLTKIREWYARIRG